VRRIFGRTPQIAADSPQQHAAVVGNRIVGKRVVLKLGQGNFRKREGIQNGARLLNRQTVGTGAKPQHQRKYEQPSRPNCALLPEHERHPFVEMPPAPMSGDPGYGGVPRKAAESLRSGG